MTGQEETGQGIPGTRVTTHGGPGVQGCLRVGARKGCQEQRGREMNYRTDGQERPGSTW